MSNKDIIAAAKTGDLQTVVSCLNCGISVDERDKDNATPLYWSCCRGYTKLSAELIKWKPDVNAKVKWGSTALHASCDRGHIACATLLIDSGAYLDIKNKTANTALHLAAYRGNIDIVKLLVQRGANVFLRNDKGRCASEEAETGNHTLTAQFLYKKMKEYENTSSGSEKIIHSCPENFGKKIAEIHADDIQDLSEPDHCLSANSEYNFFPKCHSYVERSRSCGDVDIKRECARDIDLLRIGSKDVQADNTDPKNLLSFTEELQQQVLKANEDIVLKDQKIKELSAINADMATELGKYKTICRRLNDQKSALEEKLYMFETCASSEDFMFDFLREVTQVQPSCSFTEEYFKNLKLKVRNKRALSLSVTTIDTPMKEWFPGTDYVVNGDRPIKSENSSIESLTFLIRHLKSGKFCDLKMKLLGQDPSGYYSSQENASKTQELNILSSLNHPNLMKSIHSYFGTTERFRRFLSVIVPQPRGSTTSISIPKQALFIVTEHHSHTLESFFTAQRGVSPLPLYGLSNEFILTLVYQILSGVSYLRRLGIVHRNLHPGSIYLSDRLCPVIGNLELAARVFDNERKQVELTDTCQILVGNSNAWSPELLHNKENVHHLIPQKVSLLKIYEKSDVYAVGRTFYTILLPPEVDRTFQETIERNPFYTAQDIPDLPLQLSRGLKILLKSLVGSNVSERLDEQTAKLFAGVLLFAPKARKLSSIEEVRTFCHARLLSLLAKDRRIVTSSNIEEIQKVVVAELECDFFTGVNDTVFFHMYNKLCAIECLEIEQ